MTTRTSLWLSCLRGGALVALLAGAPWPGAAADPATIQQGRVANLATFATGLGGELYGSPLDLTPVPDATGRIALTTFRGVVRLVDANGTYLDSDEAPFLSTDTIWGLDAAGLTTLAFHPDYASPGSAGYGRLYTIISAFTDRELVDFPGSGSDRPTHHDAILREYTADDPASDSPSFAQRDVMRFHQRQGAHNITDLVFDEAALLYVPAGDSQEPAAAQDPSSFLGSVFRIDPLDPVASTDGELAALGLARSENGKYAIPTSNAGSQDPAALNEIFAYGIRSPFRISIDRGGPGGDGAGDIYLADVGKDTREEVSRIQAGGNHGWPSREGTVGSQPVGGSVDPVFELSHELGLNENGLVAGGVTIIGGVVYRGKRLPELKGRYIFGELGRAALPHQQGNTPRLFYGDLMSGEIFQFAIGPAGESLTGRVVLSVGQDLKGEVYALLGDDPGNELGTGGIVVKLVPEPAAALLGLCSLGTLLALRHRAPATMQTSP